MIDVDLTQGLWHAYMGIVAQISPEEVYEANGRLKSFLKLCKARDDQELCCANTGDRLCFCFAGLNRLQPSRLRLPISD